MQNDQDHIPEKYRIMFEKTATGRSRRAAIRLKCLDCSGWQNVEVRRCQTKKCPLWPYRLGGKPAPAEGKRFLTGYSAPETPT